MDFCSARFYDRPNGFIRRVIMNFLRKKLANSTFEWLALLAGCAALKAQLAIALPSFVATTLPVENGASSWPLLYLCQCARRVAAPLRRVSTYPSAAAHHPTATGHA